MVCQLLNEDSRVYQAPSQLNWTSSVAPTGLPLLDSNPDAEFVIYINFEGYVVENTLWNQNVLQYHCLPMSVDSDFNTFSATEANMIREVHALLAEAFASFNVNITTRRPSNLASANVLHALFTPPIDANGIDLPYKGSAGVAYLNTAGQLSQCNTTKKFINKASYKTFSQQTTYTLSLIKLGKIM